MATRNLPGATFVQPCRGWTTRRFAARRVWNCWSSTKPPATFRTQSATVSILKAAAPEDPVILYAAYRVYTDLAGESLLDLSLVAPKSAEMHQAMAHELLRARDLKAAIANYREALAVDPNLPGIHYELAEVLRNSSEPALKQEAEQQYALALKANPNDSRSLTRLADGAAERGEHAQAIAMYRQVLANTPNDSDAGVGLAHELVETGDLTEALQVLQAIEQADPTDVLVHFRLGSLYPPFEAA